MSIFTSEKTKWRRSMQVHATTKPQFDKLALRIGRENAKKFLELVYDWAMKAGLKIDMLAPDMVRDFMKKERKNVDGKWQYVMSLVPQSANGALGTLLNNHIRPVPDYYKNPSGGALVGRELAIDKAANWVCGGYVAGIGATKALLKDYIPATAGHHGKAGAALGRTPEHIRKIHKKSVTDAPAFRFNYTVGDVKYPSTVGASYLLEQLFQLTSGTNAWPAFGNASWESIAMFYMASIATIQAFSDGNKRAAHLAYAIVLIKGTHDFKAPTTAEENTLFRMNG